MIACIGAANVDWHGVVRGSAVLGESNHGDVSLDFGGVARNVAVNLARLGRDVSLCSRVGADELGRRVIANTRETGVNAAAIAQSATSPTASYVAILESSGELVIGLDDMKVYEEIDTAMLQHALPELNAHRHWFIDTNVPGPAIDWLLDAAGDRAVYVDAVSMVRAERLRPLLPRIPMLFASIAQAQVLTKCTNLPDTAAAAAALMAAGARVGVITAGARDAAVWSGARIHVLPVLPATPRDVTGAGDAVTAGTIFGLTSGCDLPAAVRFGLAAAAITVESAYSTAPDLSPQALRQRLPPVL